MELKSAKELHLNEYQELAMNTCLPTSNNILYMILNLQGEVGELSSKLAKMVRKGQLLISCGDRMEDGTRCHFSTFQPALTDEQVDDLKKEAGDVLWQLSGLCSVMGWNLNEIAQMNLDKLSKRKLDHTIDGNGDNR